MSQTPVISVSQAAVDPQSVDPVRGNNRQRFELELEFVQALANPFYLHSLAQQGIFSQPTFVNYLEYLLYWKEKEYARFIQWVLLSPHLLADVKLKPALFKISTRLTPSRAPAERTVSH